MIGLAGGVLALVPFAGCVMSGETPSIPRNRPTVWLTFCVRVSSLA